MEPKAVLFDLDNTLTHRGRSLEAFAPRFAARFAEELGAGASPETLAAVLVDVDADASLTRELVYAQLLDLLPWDGPIEFETFRTFWHEVFPGCAQPMPGLTETLEALSEDGFRLGIVTNGGIDSQNAKIDALGVRPLLDTVRTAEDAGIGKPDPQIFRMALEDLDVPAGRTWHVGDNPYADVAGASALGMTAVWLEGFLPWTGSLPAPDFTITALAELPPLIRSRGGRIDA